MSIASCSRAPRTSNSGENFNRRALRSSFTRWMIRASGAFVAALYSSEEIRSTLSSGIMLVIFPTAIVTALFETRITSPTMRFSFTRTFSPTFNGPPRNSSMVMSSPANRLSFRCFPFCREFSCRSFRST